MGLARVAYAALLAGGLLGASPERAAGEESPAGGPRAASTGVVWGRLSVEEESPHGPFTPLPGVDVLAYPLTPGLLRELERIRDTARDSIRQHETAVSRLREALRTAAGRSAGAGSPTGAPLEAAPQPRGDAVSDGSGPEGRSLPDGARADGAVPRRATDATGVFAFDDLPAGEWLLVAIRVTPYASRQAQARSSRGRQSRESRFSGRAASTDVQHGEVWVAPVRVAPGERVRVFWTDRSRFMAGPAAGGGS
jgi:hypothetical protein